MVPGNCFEQRTDQRALTPVVLVELNHLLEREVADNVRIQNKKWLIAVPEHVPG
jgi:hypothetical protein